MDNRTTPFCACGCGSRLPLVKQATIYPGSHRRYYKRHHFIRGHSRNRLGKYSVVNPVRRRYHERARNLVDTSACSLNNVDCLGIVEVAHIDQNYKNNHPDNIKPLCSSHHRILDNHYKNGMRFADLFNLKLEYYVSSNKRRYKKISFEGF